MIAELERHGHDTRGAQAVLTTMRETQALHQEDRGGNCKSKSRRSRANTFGCQYSKPLFDFSVGSLGMFECVAQRSDPRCRKLSLTNRRCHQARDAPAAAPHPALLKAFGTSALNPPREYLRRGPSKRSGFIRTVALLHHSKAGALLNLVMVVWGLSAQHSEACGSGAYHWAF